jgi:hypothetical protein
MKSVEDLDVFKLAHQLALKIYSTTKAFPRTDVYLVNQMRRGQRNDLNGPKRLNGWNDWNGISLRAGHIRQHRKKHQSQVQTPKS